ncbi:MAG TPA: tetratricopeptide repeat protein, partial [Sphingobacterium sp.]|nr:tetratricopeptide repeat protein [Sphingobacterium sp.]
MVRTVLLLIMTGVFSAGVFVHENNYDKAVRTYRENKLDSATWYSDLAIQHYLNNGKTDSLVLARVQKALLIWDMHGIEAAMRYTDTTLVLSAGLPPKNIARVAAFSRMGRLHVQRHELSQAARYFTKAEKEILSSVPNLHYAILYNNMAIMHFTEEKYKDARIYSERAYATNLKLEGKDGINMPIILQTRYLISLYSENYEQALQDGEEFQRVMILHYPPDHPNIGTMHNSLASLYETLRQYEKAMHHRQKAVRLHYNSYIQSGDGFSLAASYQNMGQLYGYINEPFMAQEYLEKGSRLLEKTFGRDGAGMVKPLTDIAINKSKSGKYQEAEALFERALAIQKNHARHDLLGLAYVEGFMANMYFEYKQIDRAIALYRTVADRYA